MNKEQLITKLFEEIKRKNWSEISHIAKILEQMENDLETKE